MLVDQDTTEEEIASIINGGYAVQRQTYQTISWAAWDDLDEDE